MADTKKTETQDALFDEIRAHIPLVAKAPGHPAARARALADLALAYRYAAGGTQPGSVVVEKG